MRAPPYRLETARLVVRCWEPHDAPLLKDAVDSSLEHVRPWLPWAHEAPLSLEQNVELLRRFRGEFDLDHEYAYGVFSRDESEVVGGAGLHPRRGGPEACEIGYWIRASRAGEGLGTEATAAITRAGLEVAEAARIEVRVDPENAPSLRIAQKLGFVEEGLLRRVFYGPTARAMERDALVFSLLRDELAGSPVAELELRAYDAAGERVL